MHKRAALSLFGLLFVFSTVGAGEHKHTIFTGMLLSAWSCADGQGTYVSLWTSDTGRDVCRMMCSL